MTTVYATNSSGKLVDLIMLGLPLYSLPGALSNQLHCYEVCTDYSNVFVIT